MKSKIGSWRYVAWPVLGLLAVAVMSGVVMLLWNAVAPCLRMPGRSTTCMRWACWCCVASCLVAFAGMAVGMGATAGKNGKP